MLGAAPLLVLLHHNTDLHKNTHVTLLLKIMSLKLGKLPKCNPFYGSDFSTLLRSHAYLSILQSITFKFR